MVMLDPKDNHYDQDLAGKHTLDNGWTVSVINGPHTYSDVNSYEVGVIDPTGHLNYKHPDGDVLGWQSPEEVMAMIEKISKL